MLKSIRWKFIIVYFLLVFIAMVIVGVFIIDRIEDHHMGQITNTMENHIKRIVNSSTVFQKTDNWIDIKEEIQVSINNYPVSGIEKLYIIDNSDEFKRIVATNPPSSSNSDTIGREALPFRYFKPELILAALRSGDIQVADGQSTDGNNSMIKHLVYPAIDEMGQIKGLMYMTTELNDLHKTMKETRRILTNATILALFITVFLGFFIANSITEPIKDVTIKAESMSKGDFNQRVEVRSDDEIGQLAGMFNELTLKLKNTMGEMYREKSKLDTIFTYMADGVIAVNLDGDIIHANPVAIKMLKINPDGIENQNYDQIFKGLAKNNTLQSLISKNQWQGNEIIEIGSNVYNAKYAPYKNEKNEIGGLIVVFQDITDQQKLENMRKEFVANVSHELKTPITTIKSYTETLMDGALEDPNISNQFLSVVRDECDRMARIVRDLLQLSNLDYRQTKWNKDPLSIAKVLDGVYMKIRMSAKVKKQELNLAIKGDIPIIQADKDGIEQVILNVVTNAIKYTPEYGAIDIIANTIGDNIVIRVKDNGIGIPDEDLGRIFERFYRVDKARSRALGGTGLGLSIAKQIIESHNGKIEIRSQYNQGTEVDIILPK